MVWKDLLRRTLSLSFYFRPGGKRKKEYEKPIRQCGFLMVHYKTKISEEYNKQHVLDLIRKLDSYFVPPLSERVDLTEYVNKLDHHANTIMAYGKSINLIGIIAFYDNDLKRKEGYITYLGVLPDFKGNGIASKLLEGCIDECKRKGIEYLSVETWEENAPVIHLYKKYGFKISKKVADRDGSRSLKLRVKL